MENILFKIEKEILEATYKQKQSIEIVDIIDKLGKEKEYYGILRKHAERITKLDGVLENLNFKKEAYQM